MIPFVQGSTCRGTWTPDAARLYESLFDMPSFLYTGSDYEMIEQIGFTDVFTYPYEIWENSSQYLDGYTVPEWQPSLLWTFLGPIDLDHPRCVLGVSDEIIETNSYQQPSNTPNVDHWNVNEALAVRYNASWGTPSALETYHAGHRLGVRITHGMDWEAVRSGVPDGYITHRFTVGTSLTWDEPLLDQATWQGFDLYNNDLDANLDQDQSNYFRRDGNGNLVFKRDLTWTPTYTRPTVSVVRRPF